ncbi:MAG: serine hydrolase [Myxococcota bacterium]|nr:serine hydrolase [Myxococcota bacterium]
MCLLPGIASASTKTERDWKQALDEEIAGLAQRFKGRISIYVSDPKLDLHYRHDASEPIYIASGVKVPFMIEVYRQASQGLISLNDRIPYKSEAQRDGAPRLGRVPLGTMLSVKKLVTLMIQASDNAASDMLANYVGIENINRGMRAEGFNMVNPLVTLLDVREGVFRELDYRADDLTNLQVRKVRWTWGWKSHVRQLEKFLGRPRGTHTVDQLHAAYNRFYQTKVNHVPVETLGNIIEALLAKTLVSEKASREMLEIMSNAKTSRNRMMGKLPRGTRVAHKTGSQWERICDYGAMWLPSGEPLVFAGCLAGGEDRKLAEATMASIARKAYDLAVRAHGKSNKSRR